MEGNYGDIYADGYTCNGYYIIKLFSSPYTLQEYLIIGGWVISSSEMVCEGNFFSISILIIMLYKKINPIIKFVSIGKIFNGNFNVIFHDSKDVVPYSLRSISQKYFSTLSLLHVPMEEHDNIMYKNNRIKIV